MVKNVNVPVLDTSAATPSEVASRIADEIPDPPVASTASPNRTPPQGP